MWKIGKKIKMKYVDIAMRKWQFWKCGRMQQISECIDWGEGWMFGEYPGSWDSTEVMSVGLLAISSRTLIVCSLLLDQREHGPVFRLIPHLS